MGGFRSGRRYHRKKKTIVENCFTFDIVTLRENIAVLQTGRYTGIGLHGSGAVTYDIMQNGQNGLVLYLRYRVSWTPSPMVLSERCLLTSTTPRYGGQRWWFVCPSCGRRCRCLYVPPSELSLGCRVCLELSYRSRSWGPLTRRLKKISRLKYQMGARGIATAPVAPIPPCPEGMRRKTYLRLLEALQQVERMHWQTMEQWVKQFRGRAR